MGGRAPAGPLVWVPYPQGLEKGVVVGTVKGGGGTGDTPYNVARQLRFAIAATTTAQWQKV